jgi:gluconokinase
MTDWAVVQRGPAGEWPKVQIVIMGVAGCGKSSLGVALAAKEAMEFIEGDRFHSPQAVAMMKAGLALSDADRAQWLDRLGIELARRQQGAILACSALKYAYRQQLRRAAPDLKFIYLEIDRETALNRVAARGAAHMFPATLVDSQFLALEPPCEEHDVLTLAAADPLTALCAKSHITIQGWRATLLAAAPQN